ncbi:MAG: hypothetical protein ACREMR_04800 [Gemmatimonadales bacterium]
MASKMVLATLTAVLAAAPAVAQDTSAAARPADTMEQLREKIRADKKLIVSEAMGLTQGEATAFWPVYDSYQLELAGIAARTEKLIQDYAASYQTMTPEAARRLLDTSLTIEQDRVRLMQSYVAKFRQVLPEPKVARYYQIENKIRAVVNYELASLIPLVK